MNYFNILKKLVDEYVNELPYAAKIQLTQEKLGSFEARQIQGQYFSKWAKAPLQRRACMLACDLVEDYMEEEFLRAHAKCGRPKSVTEEMIRVWLLATSHPSTKNEETFFDYVAFLYHFPQYPFYETDIQRIWNKLKI